MDKSDFSGLIKLLESYAQYFTEKSSKFNWKYELLFFDTDIKFDFVTGNENRIIAQAHSPLEGDSRIIINIDKWEELKPLERVWLFFHEYAHEVYGLEHGEIKLMYPLLPKDKLKDDFNLEDEYIVGNKDAVKSKRRNKDELLLPFLSPYCKTTALEYFRHVSKSSAYLFNAIDEFIGYISQSQYPFSKNTTLIEVEKTYPKIKSNGKVAFPEHKYVIVVPLNYKY